MLTFILRRLLLMIPTTLGVAFVIFTIFHLAPGDPATVMMGSGSGGEMGQNSDTQGRVEQFKRRHGLDRNIVVQFLDYIGPFNFDRDGLALFSSPFTERITTPVTAPDGEIVQEGAILPIGYLPGTDEAILGADLARSVLGVELADQLLDDGRIDLGAHEDELEADGWVRVVVRKDEDGEDILDEFRSKNFVHLRMSDFLDDAREVLMDDDASEASWAEARRTILAAADHGLPALFTSLHDLQESASLRGPAIHRICAVLEESTGATQSLHPARVEAIGNLALVRAWFAWYYANGGYRVQNTGKKTWGGLLAFDLGNEMQSNEPVAPEIWKRLLVTVPLALASVLLSYLIALPLGIFSARNKGKKRDGVITLTLFVLFAIPTFWAGLMLILIFGGTNLDLLPVIGLHDKDAADFGPIQYAWDTFLHCILPVATMTYGSLAYLSRQMRAGMMDTLQQDYIRTARAKGLSEDKVIYKHALRNSMIPVLTLLASVLPVLIGGSIIVEKVFEIPGMGRYAFEGLLNRDFNIIMATTLFVGVMTQFGILLSDITYSIVDPRIRHE